MNTMNLAAAALWLAGLITPAAPAGGQSLLDRSPNLAAGWVGSTGSLYFNFVHRFSVSDAPLRKVSNVPTFAMGVGLPARTLLAAHYATNSQLAPAYPNEWELIARTLVFAQADGSPLDVAAQVGYNLAAAGVDGEVSLARRAGPLRVIGAARIMSDPLFAGQTRFAPAVGATFRLTRHIALAGDIATLLDRREEERMAWSAGIHFALPLTPHTLSLHASNTNAATLQGASRGEDLVRYGFEFTVPVTLARYLPRPEPRAAHEGAPRPEPSGPSPTSPTSPVHADTVEASIKGLAYQPARLEIRAGTTVVWKNDDPLAHTVTAEDERFDSGPIEPGATWSYTFTEPGTYPFLCTPHPFMKGTVVVQ